MSEAIFNVAPCNIASQYRFREDLGLLFNPKTGEIHHLQTETAIDIFKAAVGASTIDDVISIITDTYDVSYKDAKIDVINFLNKLNISSDEITPKAWYTVDKGFHHRLKFPIRIEIELTSVCNWSCGFCYNVWKIDPGLSDAEIARRVRGMPNKHIPLTTATKLLDECASKGCFVVRYSGGEPMIHPDFMQIIKYGGTLGLYQVVFTNGHFLTPERVVCMAEANVRCVLISIHGDRATQNRLAGNRLAYDRAVTAMELALKAGIEVVAETTLVQENVYGILDIIRDVYQRGVREFRVMRYVATGKHDEKFAVPPNVMLPLMAKIEELKISECPDLRVGWPCGQKFCTSAEDTPLHHEEPTMALRFEQLTGHCESGLVWGSVSYDGRVRNCPHSNVYFGDLNEGLEPSWQRMTEVVEKVVAPRDSCGGCSVQNICKGGCHLPHFLSPPTLPSGDTR